MRRRRSSLWVSLLVKPAILIGLLMLVDRWQHVVGIQPCFVTRLAASLAGLTGLSDDHCFALLVVLALYAVLQLSRAIFGLVAAPSGR